MFQEPLTAEFALTQLEALANDEDVWDVESFNQYLNEDERERYEEYPSEYCKYFLEGLISSEWQSLEELLKFYKVIGLEAFESAATNGEVSIFGAYITNEIVPRDMFYDLYKRVILLAEKVTGKEYDSRTTPSELFQGVDLSGVPTEQEEVRLIYLIPGAAAYTWDHHWEYLSYSSSRGFDGKTEVNFYCEMIQFLGNGYLDDGREGTAVVDIARFAGESTILSELFQLQWNGAVYNSEFTNYLCENEAAPSGILKAIALAAIGNFENLENDCSSICETDMLQEAAKEWDDDEKTSLCKKILEHANCTDDIREAIEDYLAKQEDE